jgi:protoporphyrinogen oxidase
MRRSPQTGFWYPSGGFGRIPEAMAADLEARGGSVLLSTEVRTVEASYRGVTVGLGDGGELRARTLITTTSPRALLSMFSESPLIVREAVQQLRHRAAVFVYLSVPMHRYTDFQSHHFPELSTAVLRLSEPKAYRASTADPVGRTVLCAELPATVGDEVWNLDEQALAAKVREDLLSVGLPDPKPTTVHVERRVGVYPVYELGYDRRLRVVDAWINGVPNVVAMPRQTLFATDNTHQALATGEAIAACLRHDGSVDAKRWREAHASIRTHLVEG